MISAAEAAAACATSMGSLPTIAGVDVGLVAFIALGVVALGALLFICCKMCNAIINPQEDSIAMPAYKPSALAKSGVCKGDASEKLIGDIERGRAPNATNRRPQKLTHAKGPIGKKSSLEPTQPLVVRLGERVMRL